MFLYTFGIFLLNRKVHLFSWGSFNFPFVFLVLALFLCTCVRERNKELGERKYSIKGLEINMILSKEDCFC